MSTTMEKIRAMIPGTKEYDELVGSQSAAITIMQEWETGERVYSQLKDRIQNNRDFYEGILRQQFNSLTAEGELRITTNIGATVVDLIVFLLSNNPPTVQAKPRNTEKLSQIEASIAEELANKALTDSKFKQTFRNTCWVSLMAGFAWWYPFWNNRVKYGKKKNQFDFSLLNPFTTRVYYESTDYTDISFFITQKRMTPESIYEMYDGLSVMSDSENPFLPQSIRGEGLSEDKTTVFKKYDKKNVITVIDAKVVKTEAHDFDFTPLIQINNKFLINDAHGLAEVDRWKPIAQELNMLISASSEIARDRAWPPVLEVNNALGGRKLPKMRGSKIPVRRSEKNEGLEYLNNPADMSALLEQIRLLLDMLHFVSLMPKAAAGIFESSVTSGFQARIAMQPATSNTENKKLDFEIAIVELVKSALWLIEKNDPKALEVDENTKLTELYDLDFEVKWPDNLPIDVAREIQNLILGIQNSLTSVTQAVDRYNVLMDLGTSEETIDYLQQEADDAKTAPDRALKVAQVQQALAQIEQSTAQLQEKLNLGVVPEDVLPGGNPTNAVRAMGGRSPEEKRPVPDTAREAVTAESTGGQVPGGLV